MLSEPMVPVKKSVSLTGHRYHRGLAMLTIVYLGPTDRQNSQ